MNNVVKDKKSIIHKVEELEKLHAEVKKEASIVREAFAQKEKEQLTCYREGCKTRLSKKKKDCDKCNPPSE